MFTGIVQRALPITTLTREPGLIRLGIEFPDEMREGLNIGASVALDGICMTVTNVGHNGLVSFDAVQGTIDRTTIGDRAQGEPVNVERSIKFGDEVGGHMLSGHIADTATIIGIDTGPAAYLQFTLPDEWQKYIFKRGYIAINGCSLTVAEADETLGIYRINLIPETLRVTSLGRYHPGDRINFEIDSQTQIMVDTMERCFERYGVKPRSS